MHRSQDNGTYDVMVSRLAVWSRFSRATWAFGSSITGGEIHKCTLSRRVAALQNLRRIGTRCPQATRFMMTVI